MVLSSKQVMIKTIEGIGISVGMKRQHGQMSHVAQSEALNCPRCDSANTKFCYYNNYNKSQPRHFCRACKRHWTKGGTLRNVPVGGGRKNKRLKKSPDARHASLPPDIHRRGSDDHDDKSVSEILYQAMLIRPNNHTTTGAPPPSPPVAVSSAAVVGAVPSPVSLVLFPHSNQTLNFSAASSPFESGSCLSSMSQSIQLNNGINGGSDYGQLNGVVSNQEPWKQLVSNINCNGNNNNNGLEYNNSYWNFEDIDTLVSADHINLSWEDSIDIIKP